MVHIRGGLHQFSLPEGDVVAVWNEILLTNLFLEVRHDRRPPLRGADREL
jgi:hypothetical protein